MTEPIILVEDIHKSYLMGKEAVPALRGVSLQIQRGEIVCLMGPSGSGKTTLLNIIGGLDEPSRGHLIVEGENLVSLNENQLARLRLRQNGLCLPELQPARQLHRPGKRGIADGAGGVGPS
jgi:putative ABC transport system ATP-binding protein